MAPLSRSVLISFGALCFAMHFGQSCATRPSIDIQLAAGQDKSLVTETEKESLVTETDQSCSLSELKSKSSHLGAGGNAFVIKLTAPVCGGATGDALKAFQDAQERDDAVDVLVKLPEECGLAGLKCNEADKDNCKLQANCVNSEETDIFPESATCYYMRMTLGGSKTIEQCLESGTTHMVGLMLSSVKRLQCIHSKGFYHNDYQLKNIMANDKCDPASVKVIDLDGMDDKSSNTKPAGEYWGAEFRAWRDYLMLFGSCEMGASELEDLAPANEKTKAKQLRELAESHTGCKWDESKTWDDILQMGIAIEKGIEAMR